MENLTIHLLTEPVTDDCALCGESTLTEAGPYLSRVDSAEPVCRACGRRHAPHLMSLVDLGHVAQRVGRTCGHTLVPPMEALLALARAAEDFHYSAPAGKRLKRAS